MKGLLKKRIMSDEAWKVFSVASFLFITIFFILPYLVQISTYFHEKGHQKIFDKYGIENLWIYNLRSGWRLVYSVSSPDKIEILAVVLDWMDHKDYERLFNF